MRHTSRSLVPLILVLTVPGQSLKALTTRGVPVGQSETTFVKGVKAFVIQMSNGVAACRSATRDELPATIPSRNNPGVPVAQLLSGEQGSISDLRSEVSDLRSKITTPVPNAANGLTIELNALSQLQSDSNRSTVIAAFQRAAALWTARIKTPITIRINIDYGFNRPNGSAFPEDVVGSTSSGSVSVEYQKARSHMLNGASNSIEAAIYNSLPASAVPVNTGNGAAVEVTRSIGQALGFLPLDPSAAVATISFNKNMPFDFNPDNGISFSRLDFVGTAAHEIGHALGFVSNAGGGSTAPLTTWDMFRFRSGTTPGTFTSAQRIMTIGGSQMYYTTQAFRVEGVNASELALSNGGPDGDGGDGNQSSHWKANDLTGRYIGIMDPSIGLGELLFTTENDFSALETFGWNLVSSNVPPPAPSADDNDGFAGRRTLVGCTGSVTGTNLNASRETGEPNHSPDNNGGAHSVWHTWQAPSSASTTFTTAGSAYDTVLAIYTGSAVNGLTAIARNDDIPDVPNQPHQVTSSVTFSAVAGTTYQIAVDGYNNGGQGGDMGPLKLNWTQSSCIEPARLIIAEDNSNNLAAVDSVTFLRAPFAPTTNFNFSADRRTRLTFLIYGLGLTTADAGLVNVQAAGITLQVENVGPFTAPGLSATYVVVRIPEGMPAGHWPLSVTVRGAAGSNNPLLGIGP